MKFPSYLSAGDKVAVVSPAGRVSREQVEHGAALLRKQGFEVLIGRHVFDEDGVFAGSDEARAADMQSALDDASVKAIFCSRGGYGCLRTHQLLNWSSFMSNPKWLVGFSDITVFHSFLARNHTASIHGVMTSFFTRDGEPTESFRMTMEMLRGRMPAYDVRPHPLDVPGSASGILTGGNLSILLSLRGTPLDVVPDGRILFIEDINEYRYHLDRMMQNLKVGGLLERLSGLIVGHFTKMKDGDTPFGLDTAETIREAVAPYGYPVVFGFPAGHELPNLPLMMGGMVSMNVSGDGTGITTENG